ncbi:ACT domain-containing protein [Alteromonadaceae bacterium BrNp21-10]|nr:ACT domain-containing protein [Alteromonadaceae bacterium BrNp21-10]
MKHIVITLVGADRTGIVENVSSLIFKFNGNWLASNLSKMAGQFAGIIEIMIPDENLEGFETELTKLKGLRCIVNEEANIKNDAEDRRVSISIVGNDKPGIIQEVTSAINHAGANVVKLQSVCESAPNWGGELFKADILISLPAELDIDDVTDNLEAIANDLVVEINLK